MFGTPAMSGFVLILAAIQAITQVPASAGWWVLAVLALLVALIIALKVHRWF